MTTLSRDLRRLLERTVIEARRAAESGAHKALESLAVGHHEPYAGMSPAHRALRNRLRAHARQLGDHRDEKRGTQGTERLTAECAYEHWHRMLFARFLAENALLIEPKSGMDITLEDCQALARERGRDWLELAAEFAERMLPQIFRTDDPTLAVQLSAETQQALEKLLKDLPTEMFTADDSLGWVYQFWQSEQKDAVNKSGKKIGAEELPAVTQLFTEDYMVWFLLHNTLGAWWAGKQYPEGIDVASEEEARKAVSLPGVTWDYLRFLKGEDGKWRPAAGMFEGWPKTAKEVTVLDPCMGSGHFLMFALPMLEAMRRKEEGLSLPSAVAAVLKDNLFGLEIDPRCTQLAAFNLALAAWKLGGHQTMPSLNLACSGLAPNAKLTDWVSLAGDDEKLRNGMERLYRLFKDAPVLGSLINPRASGGDLLDAAFNELKPLLERALAGESKDDMAHELAIAAKGVARAAEIVSGQFTLVATNVPYLGRGKQDLVLKQYCERVHPAAKADLATCFVERCLEYCRHDSCVAVVAPQNWWFLGTYASMRRALLSEFRVLSIAPLGEEAWQSFADRGPIAGLVILDIHAPESGHAVAGIDALSRRSIEDKKYELRKGRIRTLGQRRQYESADHRLTIDEPAVGTLLKAHSTCSQGIGTADANRYIQRFWEGTLNPDWVCYQMAPVENVNVSGCHSVLRWEGGSGSLASSPQARICGQPAWGRRGVAVAVTRDLYRATYLGGLFDCTLGALISTDVNTAAPVTTFVLSEQFPRAVRQVDKSLSVTESSLLKVSFDLAHWQKIASEKYPDGLPKPHSDDPTQWLFNGHPKGSDQPLQVAVARLLGYRWPRQTGSEFMDCPALGSDGLETHADDDGIVCISAIKGEDAAADRLRALLAAAYGKYWNAGQLNTLLSGVGFAGQTLDDWLRDGFFEQHCALFHQRPFIWHLWDGRRDGFHALVNYHKLAAERGQGRRTLEKLTYAYLGDWIDRQRNDQKAGVEGADGRVAAAEHLQAELKKILEGEPPYDVFVRWKPLHQQAIGWEPDINDGVRLNIRPFITARPLSARGRAACILRVTPKGIKWDKDRGKEPQRGKDDYPWFWGWDEEAADFAGGKAFDGVRWNDLHYSRAAKVAARSRHTR